MLADCYEVEQGARSAARRNIDQPRLTSLRLVGYESKQPDHSTPNGRQHVRMAAPLPEISHENRLERGRARRSNASPANMLRKQLAPTGRLLLPAAVRQQHAGGFSTPSREIPAVIRADTRACSVLKNMFKGNEPPYTAGSTCYPDSEYL